MCMSIYLSRTATLYDDVFFFCLSMIGRSCVRDRKYHV